jgi:hypothetical protein
MNSMQMRNVLIFFSSALFLSVPAVWEYHHHNYRYARDSHTAMINEETKLKQKKSEIQIGPKAQAARCSFGSFESSPPGDTRHGKAYLDPTLTR